MVEVFKTNVSRQRQASALLSLLSAQFPQLQINFDLEDCDRILRVEGRDIPADKIMDMINNSGFYCEALVY